MMSDEAEWKWLSGKRIGVELHNPKALGKPTIDKFSEAELSKLGACAEEKNRLQDELDKVLQQAARLKGDIINKQREYGTLYNAPSGLSKLPNEILCRIFRWTQIMHTKHSIPLWPLSELVITAVCSRWRALALAYPAMWTFFYYQGRSDIDLAQDRFEAYLTRSQTQLLDVWVDFTGFIYPPGRAPTPFSYFSDDPVYAFLDLISRNGHRYQRLSLVGEGNLSERLDFSRTPSQQPKHLEYLQYCPGATPKLEDVGGDNDGRIAIIEKWVPGLALDATVPLTYVRLDRLSLLCSRPPLAHIVHLRIEQRELAPLLDPDSVVVQLSWTAFKEVMQLPTLETASFFGQVIAEPDPNSNPGDITAPKLKHARFGGFGIDPIEFILPRLQAPKLETITLREVMSEDSTNYPPLEDDMFPSLRSLYLIHAHAKPAGWDRLVDLTRSAKHLIIAPHIRNLAALVATPDAFAWTSRNFDKLWSKLESVTYNTHVDPLVANRWPAETVVRLPEGVSHRHRQNNRVLPINGSGDGVFMPEFWPPDFAWGDNSDDPFVVEEDDEWDY